MARKATKKKNTEGENDLDVSKTLGGRIRKPMRKGYQIIRDADPESGDLKSIPAKAARNFELGRRLRAAMLANGMKQIELAQKTGIGRDSISGYARGRIYPAPDRIKSMADVLGILPQDLAVEEQGDLQFGALQACQMKMLGEGRAWITMNREVPAKIAIKITELVDQADELMKATKSKG